MSSFSRDYINEYGVRRHPDVFVNFQADSPLLDLYRGAVMSGKPIPVNVGGWHGMAYAVDMKIDSQIDRYSNIRITLRPTGAPFGEQPIRLKKATHMLLNGAELKIDVEFTKRMSREVALRIERALENRIMHAARSIEHDATAEINRIILDDPYTPTLMSADAIQDAWYRVPRMGRTPLESLNNSLKHVPIARAIDPAGCGRMRIEFLGLENVRKALAGFEDKLINGSGLGTPIGITSKEKKVEKKLKRFYIGKPEVIEGTDTPNWGKDTLKEAITHAEERARLTGRPQYIVKVIKVVEVKPLPVSITNVL